MKEKRKVIEIFLTDDNENDELFIDVERCEDSEIANSLMKRILHCFADGIKDYNKNFEEKVEMLNHKISMLEDEIDKLEEENSNLLEMIES